MKKNNYLNSALFANYIQQLRKNFDCPKIEIYIEDEECTDKWYGLSTGPLNLMEKEIERIHKIFPNEKIRLKNSGYQARYIIKEY